MSLRLRTSTRRRLPLVLQLIGSFGFVVAALADTEHARDRLWILLSTCLNPATASGQHCAKPRSDGLDSLHPNCTSTTQVWAQSAHFVAIRDLRMCDCPAGFVHGLALPFARITGIEAATLPEGIWKFAWDAARSKIDDEDQIALVVNPPGQRTQDQLHIHLVRRRSGACQTFPAGSTVSVPDLDRVWQTIKARAQEQHVANYGALVARCTKDAFTILVEQEGDQNPEKKYTDNRCR